MLSTDKGVGFLQFAESATPAPSPEARVSSLEPRNCKGDASVFATEQELRAAQFDTLVEQAMEHGLTVMQKLAVVAVLLFVLAIAVVLGLRS